MTSGRLDDVRLGGAYEAARGASLQRVAEARRARRVSLSDLVLVFENRETLAGALEEALRADRIGGQDEARGEIDAFAALLPADNELCACLYVDIADRAELGNRLGQLDGVDRHLFLEVGGSRAELVVEEAGGGDRAAAALVRFRLSPEQVGALERGADVAVGVEHPSCRVRTVLEPEQRLTLRADLSLPA